MTQPYETSAIDTATMNDLVKRVAELEERLQEHTGDAQGSAGQFYPHPVQVIDTAEFGGGVERLDSTGIQIKAPGFTFLPAFYFLPAFTSTPSTAYPQGSVTGAMDSATPEAQIGLGVSADATHNAGMNFDVNGGTTQNISVYLNNGATQPTVSYFWNTNGYGIFEIDNLSVLMLAGRSAAPTSPQNGFLWHNSTENRLQGRLNGITGNLSVEIQSASAAAVATNGTITTAGVSVARVAPTGAVTGVILAVGTTGGQVCTVVNEAVAANTVTFAASGTSNVADGTSSVIAGLTARRFVWDSGVSLWFPCK